LGELVPDSYYLPGLENGSDRSVFVTVVSEDDVTATEETPATVDSAASAPSTGSESRLQQPTEKTESEKQEAKTEEMSADVPGEGEESRASVLASYRPQPEADSVPTSDEESAHRVKIDETRKERPEKEKTKVAETKKERRVEAENPSSMASRPSAASPASRFRTSRGRALVDFVARIRAAIKEATIFPREAARRKQYGTVSVKFTMRRNGSLVLLRIVKSSGRPILDETALEILRKASKKFPPIPPSIRRDTITYVVPIVFKKKRHKKR
jgi:protein TonB